MPSPGEDIQSWSKIAANNGTADPLINWAEGQARASVNNSSRSEMAAHAKNRDLLNGSIVTTGSANAQQFLSGLTYTTIPTNLVVRLKIGAGLTNTASVTLNMDGLGDTLIQTADGAVLLGGELVAGSYTDLLYNGTNWIFLYSREFFNDRMTGGGGLIIGVQSFKVAGTYTYTPTPGMECCIIECIGAGGGGGGSVAATGTIFAGGGGGGGGYSRKIATAADVGASQTVIVGAAGLAGSNGPGPGGIGGATSVGTLCIAQGGLGGTQGNALPPYGGAGGSPGTGDVAIAGAPGGSGFWSIEATDNVPSGNGAPGPFGGGAVGVYLNSSGAAGSPGTGPGSGGSGGSAHNSNGAYVTGGAGAPGAIIITEFAGRGSPGRDGATGPIGPAGPSGTGTGDVLRFGIPSVGQIAQWTDASHIAGVAPTFFSNVVVQTFTASGTYTPTANMKFCMIECIGGGGGGGGCNSSVGSVLAGGGGGSGAYSRKRATAAEIGVSKTVTIGTAGAAGGIGPPTNGGNGGDSSVGTLCVAKGGFGGDNSNTGLTGIGIGGAGGSAVGGAGDVVSRGYNGGNGHWANTANFNTASGAGAGSAFGGGALGVWVNSSAANGNAGSGYGGGGGGGIVHNAGASATGGAGSAGIVVITEYI